MYYRMMVTVMMTPGCLINWLDWIAQSNYSNCRVLCLKLQKNPISYCFHKSCIYKFFSQSSYIVIFCVFWSQSKTINFDKNHTKIQRNMKLYIFCNFVKTFDGFLTEWMIFLSIVWTIFERFLAMFWALDNVLEFLRQFCELYFWHYVRCFGEKFGHFLKLF